ETWAGKGVRIGSVADLGLDASTLDAVPADDVFGQLNEAFSADPVVVSVPAGVAVDQPVVVVQWVDRDGLLVVPRLVVDVGADAEVQVLDWTGSPDDVEILTVPRTELHVAGAGRLRYCTLQVLGRRSWQIGTQVSRVADQAVLRSEEHTSELQSR